MPYFTSFACQRSVVAWLLVWWCCGWCVAATPPPKPAPNDSSTTAVAAATTLSPATDSLLLLDTVADATQHYSPYYQPPPQVPYPQPLYSIYFRLATLPTTPVDSCLSADERAAPYEWVRCDTAYYLSQYIAPDLQPIRPRPAADTLLFYLLLLVVGVFAVVRQLVGNFWSRTVQSVVNFNLAKQFFEEQQNSYQATLPTRLLYIAQALLMAIWLFMLARYYGQWASLSDMRLLGSLLLVSLAYLLVRQLLISVAAFVMLPLSPIIQFYRFNLNINHTLVAVLLTPVAYLFAFGRYTHSPIPLWILLAVLLCSHLYTIYRTWQISREPAAFYKFHYFLYLCTVEIAPWLLMAKVVHNQLS